MRRLEHRIEEKQRMDDEHLKIIKAARSKALQALAQMDVETLATNMYELRNWITEFMRLERVVMGEPESIEEGREKIEIHASIEERLKAYVPVFQELLDEGAIRLDAVGVPSGMEDEEAEDAPPSFEE